MRLMAGAVRLSGAVLVIAGLSLLLYFVAFLFWEFGASRNEVLGAILQFVEHSLLRPGFVDPVLRLLPGVPPSLVTSLHVAMVLSLPGVVLGSLGVLIVRRQRAQISVEQMRAEDRLRRVHLYRDDGRLEPFIGPANSGSPSVSTDGR